MIYGIDQTTDLRDLDTRIKKFTSKKAALIWKSQSGGYAWVGAADEDIAPSQQNWHRRFRHIYETKNWRPPSKKKLYELAIRDSSSTYPRNSLDILASLISNNGIEIT